MAPEWHTLQNGAMVMLRCRIVELSHYFCLIYIQKVFSSRHKVTVEPLMADGVFWRHVSYFSGP